jgi:hypothetical protein
MLRDRGLWDLHNVDINYRRELKSRLGNIV